MTISTVRTGVVTLLKTITNVVNVYEEEPASFDHVEKRYNGRVQWWQVDAEPLPADEGLGWFETRHQVTINGYIGVSRDKDATDGLSSDKYAATLAASVVSTCVTSANRLPGSSLGSEAPQPSAITKQLVTVGEKTVECHVIEITWVVLEA